MKEMNKFVMYGKLTAHPGKRDELASMMLESDTMKGMDGCLLYILNESEDEPDAIWIVEVWTDAEAHANSLKNENVQALIQRCRPLIANAGPVPLRPLGGIGV